MNSALFLIENSTTFSTWYHILNPKKPARLFFHAQPHMQTDAFVFSDALKQLLEAHTALGQVTSKNLFGSVIQTLLHNRGDTAIVTAVSGNDVVCRRGYRRVDEKLNQALCRKGPTLGVTINKSLRIAQCLCKRHHSGLAIGRAGELLCVWKDDSQVDRLENTVITLASVSIASET